MSSTLSSVQELFSVIIQLTILCGVLYKVGRNIVKSVREVKTEIHSLRTDMDTYRRKQVRDSRRLRAIEVRLNTLHAEEAKK